MTMRTTLLTILTAAVGLAGCGGGTHDSPTAVFETMQKAVSDQEFAAAARCLTDESQHQMIAGSMLAGAFMVAFDSDKSKQKEFAELLERHGLDMESDLAAAGAEGGLENAFSQVEDKPQLVADLLQWMLKNANNKNENQFAAIAKATLENLKVDGDSATAQIRRADGNTKPIEFVNVEERWLVSLTRGSAVSVNGEPMTFNAEDSDEWQEVGDDIEVTESVSQQQFDAAWQYSIDAQDRPAGELLKQLASECGWEWEPAEGTDAALEKTVSVEEANVSRLQVIESICRQVDLHPVYSLRTLSVAPQARTSPVCHSGPFLAEVRDIKSDPANATAEHTLQIIAAGLPTSALSQFENSITVNVDEVTAPSGESLLQDRHHGFPDVSVTDRTLLMAAPAKLKSLLRDVSEIGELKASFKFTLPLSVQTLTFDSLEPGTKVAADDLTLTLAKVEEGPTFRIESEGVFRGGSPVVIAKNDSEIVKPFSRFGMGTFQELTFTKPVTSLAVRAVTRTKLVKHEFHLGGVTLPDAARMPEKHAELKVAGDLPVSYEFERIGEEDSEKKIYCKVTNHTNKKIDQLVVDMSYRDAQGQQIKSVPYTASGGFGIPDPGQNIEVTQSGFFLTPETVSVTATPKFIRFADGTEWDQPWMLTAEDAPYVEGTGNLNLKGAAFVNTGYVGFSTNGKQQLGLSGLGGVSSKSRRSSTWSQSSGLHISNGSSCRFRHDHMEPGTHYVYLKRGDHFFVGEWIKVERDTRKQIEWSVDQTTAVRLEVSLPADADGIEKLHLLPLPADGSVGLEPEQLRRLAFSLNAAADVENGTAVFPEVASGRYLVVANNLSQMIDVADGETNTVDFAGK